MLGPKILDTKFFGKKIWLLKFKSKKIKTYYKSLVKIDCKQLRYSWYGQMSPTQMLTGQILPYWLASVKKIFQNIKLKFDQHWVIDSWDIPDMDKYRR